jgi:hypothetical protein
VITRLVPAHATITKELLALTQLFASLAFDKNDVDNQEWIIRRFTVLQDIFRDTPAYQYIIEEGREEERHARLQAQRKMLLTIVQARFPALYSLAQAQADQIQDVVVLEEVTTRVGSAQTVKEARHSLHTWKQTTTTTDEQ